MTDDQNKEGQWQHVHIFPEGVDEIDEGFEGSTINETVDDGEKSSVVPEEPVPDDATETEKELAEE